MISLRARNRPDLHTLTVQVRLHVEAAAVRIGRPLLTGNEFLQGVTPAPIEGDVHPPDVSKTSSRMKPALQFPKHPQTIRERSRIFWAYDLLRQPVLRA